MTAIHDQSKMIGSKVSAAKFASHQKKTIIKRTEVTAKPDSAWFAII